MIESWYPEPLFVNQTVFIVGGGPSLKGFDFTRLRDRRCIAINAAGADVPWADVLFFKSPDWPGCTELIESWRGLAVTVSAERLPPNVRRVAIDRATIPRARTSGQYAVSLAIMMRAKTVVLLGFDWNRQGGNYHPRYGKPGIAYRNVPPAVWGGYAARASRAGCEVLNATPDSAITEFPSVSLSDVLCRAPFC